MNSIEPYKNLYENHRPVTILHKDMLSHRKGILHKVILHKVILHSNKEAIHQHRHHRATHHKVTLHKATLRKAIHSKAIHSKAIHSKAIHHKATHQASSSSMGLLGSPILRRHTTMDLIHRHLSHSRHPQPNAKMSNSGRAMAPGPAASSI